MFSPVYGGFPRCETRFFYGSHDLMHLLPARYRDPTDDGTDFMEDNLSMDAEILIATFNCYHLVM